MPLFLRILLGLSRWEYKLESAHNSTCQAALASLEIRINDLAAQGWQALSVGVGGRANEGTADICAGVLLRRRR